MRIPLRRVFTLIELLVVISIISVLASMLLPALTRAREMGRRAVCQGNVRQLYTAHAMYADDCRTLPLRDDTLSYDVNSDTMVNVFLTIVKDQRLGEAILKCPSAAAPNNTYRSNYWSPTSSVTHFGAAWSAKGGVDYTKHMVIFERLDASYPIITEANYTNNTGAVFPTGNHTSTATAALTLIRGMNVAWGDGAAVWLDRSKLTLFGASNYRDAYYPTGAPRLDRDYNSSTPKAKFFVGSGIASKIGWYEAP